MTVRPYSQQILRMTGAGTEPDPAVYCPLNGFIPDPEIYIPPVELPAITVESIICICKASKGWRALTLKYKLFSSGNTLGYLYEIFDGTGSLVNSFYDMNKWMDFDFPTTEGYYTVKISVTSPAYFTGWYNNEALVNASDSCVEAIIFNCPNMTAFTQKSNINLTKVSWVGNTFNSLTGWAYMFTGCKSMSYFTLPTITRQSIAGCYQMFAFSGIKRLNLSAINVLTTLGLADSIVDGAKYLDEIIMPSNFAGTRYNSLFKDTIRLRKITMPTSWTNSEGVYDFTMANMFSYSGVEGEIIMPEIPTAAITNVSNTFYYAANVTAIKFIGDWNKIAFMTNLFTGATSLITFEAPRILKSTVLTSFSWPAAPFGLKYFIGPDIGYIGVPVNSTIVSITGENDTSGIVDTSKPLLNIPYTAKDVFTTITMIKCRVRSITLGPNASYKFNLVTRVDIDWANSPFTGSAPQIMLVASLDETELNRIIGLLPTVTASQVMDIGNCDGYLTCTRSIAQAKGWLVRGLAFLTTDSVTSIAQTTAVSGGNITDGGSYSPTVRGVCWALSPAVPTIANAKTSNGTGIGAFISNITGLTANRTYNVRAYATTTYGTSYGQQVSFTTLP